MEKQRFYHLLLHPEETSKDDIVGLRKWQVEYPYFALPHVLLAKEAHSNAGANAEPIIEQASAYVLNRKSFKDYLRQTKKIAEIPKLVSEERTHVAMNFQDQEIPNYQEPSEEPKTADKEEQVLETETAAPFQETELELSAKAEKEESQAEKKEVAKVYSPVAQAVSQEDSKSQMDKLKERYAKSQSEKAKPAYQPQPIQKIEIPEPKGIFKRTAKNKKATNVQQEERLVSIKQFWAPPKKSEINLVKGRTKYTQKSVIEHFIRNQPSITRSHRTVLSKDERDLSERSAKLETAPVSETFAKILTMQEKNQEAIEVYKQLQLLNPEKSGYFASKIKELDSSQLG